MFTIPRGIYGPALSCLLTGCAAQQTPVEKRPVPEEAMAEEKPTPATASLDPIGCNDVADLIKTIDQRGYEGRELMRMLLGSIFTMADLVGGRVELRGNLRNALIQDLETVEDLSDEQRSIIRWIADAESSNDRVTFDCAREKLEDVSQLTIEAPKYYVSPFRDVDQQAVHDLLTHYGLPLNGELRKELGGRVLGYQFNKDAPNLAMVYLTERQHTTLQTYSAALKRQIASGLRHIAILGATEQSIRTGADATTQHYVEIFQKYPDNPEQGWANINKVDPGFETTDAIEYYLLSLAAVNSELRVYGVDDIGMLYLSDRFAKFAQIARSLYLKRYFIANAHHALDMRTKTIIAGLQKVPSEASAKRIVRLETHGGLSLFIEMQQLAESDSSYILVRSD